MRVIKAYQLAKAVYGHPVQLGDVLAMYKYLKDIGTLRTNVNKLLKERR